jgi:hypothetical protein
MLRRDRSFQILERINNNAYKVDLSGEYGVVLLLMFMISLCLMQEMIRCQIILRREGMIRSKLH